MFRLFLFALGTILDMQDQKPTNGTLSPDSSGGQGVSILGDPHHNRADAIMARRMIAMGCVPPEKVNTVLSGAYTLAAQSIVDRKPRDYAAAMSVPLAVAKLELEIERLEMEKAKGNQPGTTVNVNINWDAFALPMEDTVEDEIAKVKALGHASNGQSPCDGNGAPHDPASHDGDGP